MTIRGTGGQAENENLACPAGSARDRTRRPEHPVHAGAQVVAQRVEGELRSAEIAREEQGPQVLRLLDADRLDPDQHALRQKLRLPADARPGTRKV